MYRVSFTGHRPSGLPFFGEDDPMCVELKQRLSVQIEQLIKDGATEFYTGMALGVDIWAAEAVIAFKDCYPEILLIAVKPCPNQCKGWSRSDIQRYDRILQRCNKVMTISPEYESGCMLRRDRALVELCDILIAVYSGAKSGGTAYTVNYARQKLKKLIIVPPV